jgi:hypothetical protein
MTVEIKKNIASTVYINTPETSWALFTYSETGDLFLSSDWGSYTHRWKGFGDDFEHFLKGLSIEYFVDKISKPDVNQHRPHIKQKEILTLLVGHFIEALKNQTPETNQPKNILEIKGELIDTHNDYESWLKTVSTYVQRFGFNKKVVHVNKNGFNTTGYDLKNFEDKNVFPVKSYLLLSETEEPTPFKSISNN